MPSPHSREDEVMATEATTPETLLAENASLQGRLLRALAEAENVRRQADRDAAETRKFAVTEFARELLPVVDNLQRVLGATVREGDPDALRDGVAMTLRSFPQTFERFWNQEDRRVGGALRSFFS